MLEQRPPRRQDSGASPLICAAGACAGAVAFFCISSAFGYDNALARLALMAASIPPFWAAIAMCRRDRDEPVSLLATLYFLFGLILPGMAHSAFGQFPFFRTSYPESDVLTGSLVIFLFSISFFLPIILHQPRGRIGRSLVTVNSATLAAWAILLSAIGLLVALRTGLAVFISARGDSTFRVFSVVTVAMIATARFSTFSAFAMCLYNMKFAESRSPFLYIALVLTGCTALTVNFPLSLPRFVLLSYLISTAIILFPLGLRRFKVAISILYPLMIVTIFPALSVLTRGGRGESVLKDWGEYYTTSGDLDGFQSVINVVRWVEVSGFQHGKQTISAIFSFVPRDIWPDKALPTGVSAALANGYTFTNISAPLPSEVFADFGWPGLIILGGALGYLIAKSDDYLSSSLAIKRASGIISMALLAGFIAILFRGSLMAVITPCALALIISQFSRLAESKGSGPQPSDSGAK